MKLNQDGDHCLFVSLLLSQIPAPITFLLTKITAFYCVLLILSSVNFRMQVLMPKCFLSLMVDLSLVGPLKWELIASRNQLKMAWLALLDCSQETYLIMFRIHWVISKAFASLYYFEIMKINHQNQLKYSKVSDSGA